MEIRPLGKTSFDTIYEAFDQAFADYEIQQSRKQLQAMLKRRGFNPDLSFAVFDGNRIIAFTLNGTGNFNGLSTAYDTGTGTLKEYRGVGLATQIFEYSIPYLKEKGIRQYLLEVLQHNTKAVSIYRNLGFKVVRDFNYFIHKSDDVNKAITKTDIPCSIERIDNEKLYFMTDFWDFYPSWQNNFESIKRTPGSFVGLGAFIEKKCVGYCVFEPASGDITQIAVDKQYRRKGIASLLFSEITGLNKNDVIKVINTDVLCSSITGFLQAKNMNIKGRQFEMIKPL